MVVGYLLLRGAAVAADKLADHRRQGQGLLPGKIAAAKFFADNVLPGVGVQRALAESVTNELMELPEEAF